MSRYRIKVYSGYGTYERLIVEHKTDYLQDAKFYFFHWIAEYFHTEMNANRRIIVNEEFFSESEIEVQKRIIIAKCRIYRDGEIGTLWAVWN